MRSRAVNRSRSLVLGLVGVALLGGSYDDWRTAGARRPPAPQTYCRVNNPDPSPVELQIWALDHWVTLGVVGPGETVDIPCIEGPHTEWIRACNAVGCTNSVLGAGA